MVTKMNQVLTFVLAKQISCMASAFSTRTTLWKELTDGDSSRGEKERPASGSDVLMCSARTKFDDDNGAKG